MDELAADPAHGGRIRPNSLLERDVAIGLETTGQVPAKVTRDPTGQADFIDGLGQRWDVKGFVSGQLPRMGYFDLMRDAGKVDKSLAQGEYVMLDTRRMNQVDVQALQSVGASRGWGQRVKWWP
jgi:hypothetical protein